MSELGYKEHDIELMLNHYSLKKMRNDTLLKKINETYQLLLTLGYTKEEVIKMTKRLPAIYSLSIENIKQKMEDIVKAVNTKEEGGEGRADDLIARFEEERRKEETEHA